MASTNELQKLDCGDITCDLEKFEAGTGGFGDVIFGYHNGLKKEVAIKVFKVDGATHKKLLVVKMFQEEMEHLLKADHKNVVRIFGYVQWNFAMGIVMEYCKGGDLETLLMDTSKELGLAVRVRIVCEIATAMAFCHNLPDKRLIHQDLKPGNILLTEKLQCKVGDFGSAELATHSTSVTVNPLARSKKERPQYTPYYTAPEKLKDLTMKPRKEHDVYAYSMIFYFVLARKSPYPRLAEEERSELLQQIKKGKRPDCQEIQDWIQTLAGEDREIAEQLQLLMKRCWDQDPTKRPTMTEIKEELKNLLEKQNPENLLSQVESVAREMVVNQPSTNESQRVSLHYFSPRTGRFEVPSTKSSRTVERPIKPSGRAQKQGSSQQGEISTSSRSQQPDDSDDCNQFVQKYVHLLQTKKYDEAKTTKQQLSKSIEGQLAVTAEDLEDEATKRRNDGKYLEAILFSSVAADVYVKKNPDFAVARKVTGYAKKIRETIKLLMKNSSDLFSKLKNIEIVQYHVIPLMRGMIQHIRDLQINDEIRCLKEVRCLHHIELSQYYIEDLESSETTLKRGLEIMETKFGNESSKYSIYGTLLNNLGFVCEKTLRLKEAVEYYTKAIEVYITAEDLPEAEQKEWVTRSEKSLERNKKKILLKSIEAIAEKKLTQSFQTTSVASASCDDFTRFSRKRCLVRDSATVSKFPRKKYQSSSSIARLNAEVEQKDFVHTDSQGLSSKGGTLRAGGCQITIPKDACDKEVKIVITSHYGSVNAKVENDFTCRLTPMLKCEPEGFTFKKPIEITLPTCYRNVDESPVSVEIRHKTNGSDWEVLKQCLMDQTTQSFTFQTVHFSFYDVICTVGKFIGLMKETKVIFAVPSYEEEIVSEFVATVFICDNIKPTKNVKTLKKVYKKKIRLGNHTQDGQIQVSAEGTKVDPERYPVHLENIQDSFQLHLARPEGENWKRGSKKVRLVMMINRNIRVIDEHFFVEKRHFNPPEKQLISHKETDVSNQHSGGTYTHCVINQNAGDATYQMPQ